LTCCNSGYSIKVRVTPDRCEPSSSPKATGEVNAAWRLISSIKLMNLKLLAGSGCAG
jgi:hypothetical protein